MQNISGKFGVLIFDRVMSLAILILIYVTERFCTKIFSIDD